MDSTPPLMLQVVGEAVLAELTLDRVPRAAHAGALRAAPLNHKAGDAAVEDQAVVEALLDQRNKIVYAVGGHLGVELRFDEAAVFHLNGNNGIWHGGHSPFLL